MNLFKLHKNPETLHRHAFVGEIDVSKLQDALQWEDSDQHFSEPEIDFIKLHPKLSYFYALNTIRGPWPPGEKVIATTPEWAYEYAHNVIGGIWKKGEKVIASDGNYSYMYAVNTTHERFPAGEKLIAKNHSHALNYARSVIKGKWPPGEKAIEKATRPQSNAKEIYNNFLRSKGYSYDELI